MIEIINFDNVNKIVAYYWNMESFLFAFLYKIKISIQLN